MNLFSGFWLSFRFPRGISTDARWLIVLAGLFDRPEWLYGNEITNSIQLLSELSSTPSADVVSLGLPLGFLPVLLWTE